MPNHTTEHRRLRSDVQSILDCLLLRALEISQASYGNVQLMDWDAGHLVIKAQYGFQDEFLRFFKRVKLGEGSACARAREDSGSVLVEDVMEDALLLPYRQIMRRAGVRAVQSTALRSTSGALIGVLSTHFPVRHRPTDDQIEALRDAGRAAANVIIELRAGTGTNGSRRLEECQTRFPQSRLLQSPAALAPQSSRRFDTYHAVRHSTTLAEDVADAEKWCSYVEESQHQLAGIRARNHATEELITKARRCLNRVGWVAGPTRSGL